MKRYIIIFLLLITSIMLVGCKGKTTIKESKLEEALKVFDNENYQIKYTYKWQSNDGTINTHNYEFVNYGDILCINEYDYDESVYIEYNNGKIKAAFPSRFKDIYFSDESHEINDFFDDMLGELNDFSCYSWKEILQTLIWEEFDTYKLTFLSDDEVKNLLQKVLDNSDWNADDVNESYQDLITEGFMYKEFSKFDYNKEEGYYLYSDSKCDLKYYFSKSKLVKLEYKDLVHKEEHILEFTYNKEKVDFPKTYIFANTDYAKYEVKRGDRRDLSEDINVNGINIDCSTATIVISDDDFAEINTKTSTITFNLFAKATSAYVGFIVGDNLYMLKYYFD